MSSNTLVPSDGSKDLEIRNNLNSLYKIFMERMAKILSGHTKVQRSVGPLSKRDQAVVDEYKHFLKIGRKYEQDFYDDMFTAWSRSLVDPEFIFDEPIEFEVSRHEHFFINLPVLHEWGLRNVETKGYVAEIEKVLLTIASIFHPDERMANSLKNRLRELSPQPRVPTGVPQGNPLQGDMLKNMMGNMLNGIKNMPMFKDQLPENFDGNEFTNAVLGSKTMTNVLEDMKSGNFNMEKLGSIVEDPSLKEVFEKLGDAEGEKKPTSFAELPKELQPPGEPLYPTGNPEGKSEGNTEGNQQNPSSPPSSASQERTPKNDLALFSKAAVNEFVTGGYDFNQVKNSEKEEKGKEPMVPPEGTMEID